MEYKRLTKRFTGSSPYTEYASDNDILCRLAEIEDKIEQGTLKEIPENAVVLTEKELKEKIDCCDVSMIHHDDDGKRYIEYERYEDFTDRLGKRIQQLKGQLKQARKETAEKFAERLKCLFDEYGKYAGYHIHEIIDEIAKEFTEGKV